jgi:hypothetical protein
MGIAALAACGHSNPHLRLDTGSAPWPNPDHVDERISAAGLSSASTEALTVHYHAHLDIFVNGKSEPVAPSIGREDRSLFSPDSGCSSPSGGYVSLANVLGVTVGRTRR